MTHKPKILVVYKFLEFPLRTTIDEHLYSFKRYADAEVYYIMLDIGPKLSRSSEPIPNYLLNIDFDIILYHYSFVSGRNYPEDCYAKALEQIKPLKSSKAVKAVITQDEYYCSRSLSRFINENDIKVVFTLATETEARKIFDQVDFNKVKFHRVLTGYIDDENIKTVNALAAGISKTIDIGYRARNLPQWLGRHGYLKTVIADVFNERLRSYKLNASISTDPNDTFFGFDWYKFLLRCKYMIGVEGGATILDPEGDIHLKSMNYLKDHPSCTFEEIEAACFPNLDGKLELINISPRHLECCVTRTCQLLVESSFNNILKPWVHYIPIKPDLSNIDEVLEIVRRDEMREQISENAYKDIVLSGNWSYRSFVNFVIEKSMKEATSEYFSRKTSGKYLILKYNHYKDKLAHKKYVRYQKGMRKLNNKWTYLMPIIDLIKFLRLKSAAKITYKVFTGRSWS